MGHLHLLPFARLSLVVQNVTPDRGTAVVPVLPLDVDGIAGRAGGVQQRGCRWNCKTIVTNGYSTLIPEFFPIIRREDSPRFLARKVLNRAVYLARLNDA